MQPLSYGTIQVGTKNFTNAVFDLLDENELATTIRSNIVNKDKILRALAQNDLAEQREISRLFYKTNGIYQKVCNTYAYMYRYDWYAIPETYDDGLDVDVILRDEYKVLNYLDESYVRKMCGDIAQQVIINGAYYGYVVPSKKRVILQDLPIKYCRSRYTLDGEPVVEFDMRYFDTFRNVTYRQKILDLFPEEFKEGYILFKQHKLPTDDNKTFGSWFALNPANTVKFNLNHSDVPIFINALPSIIDLEQAQIIDRLKQKQSLLHILIQEIPLDKNNDLIFDMDEISDMHENAKEMLADTIGTSVLTTFNEVKDINLSDNTQTTATDALERVERAVYNALGVSQNLFNASGNLSMEKSVLNDETSLRDLIFQFDRFFTRAVRKAFTSYKKYNFKVQFLETTQYNYKELAKMYKEQTQLGFSKMLPQIALGHSQSVILSTAYFENKYLHLSEIMIPPLMSSTLNAESFRELASGETGRPELSEGEKSDKTLQNEQSMS